MKKVVTGHGPPNTCYDCGTPIPDWTGVNGKPPGPGDYSVCTTCCAVFVWSETEGKFIEPDEDRKVEIRRYPDVRNIVALIKRIARAQNRFLDDDDDDDDRQPGPDDGKRGGVN